MGKFHLFTRISRPFNRLYAKQTTEIDRQRLSLLLFCYFPIIVLFIPANMANLTEPRAPFFNYTHSACLIASITAVACFLKEKISIAGCMVAHTNIAQAVLTIEMLYCAFNNNDYNSMLIMANTVILALNTMGAMAAYLRRSTFALGISTIVTYITCALISDDELLESFIPVFIITFSFVCSVGLRVATTTRILEDENIQLKKGETELLHLLRLNKREVEAYLALATKEHTYDGTLMLLRQLDKKTRYNLIWNVRNYLNNRATDLSTIEEVFPEFTPSERDICRLIMQEKKLGEICTMLNKSESNINSQRANMRKKLGLKPSDNLQQKLNERLVDSGKVISPSNVVGQVPPFS